MTSMSGVFLMFLFFFIIEHDCQAQNTNGDWNISLYSAKKLRMKKRQFELREFETIHTHIQINSNSYSNYYEKI